MNSASKSRGSRNPLRENSAHSLTPESCLLSGCKCKRERSREMKENMSANNTERILNFWEPISKEIDMECEKPCEIIEEIHPKKLRKGESAKRISAIQFIFAKRIRRPHEEKASKERS